MKAIDIKAGTKFEIDGVAHEATSDAYYQFGLDIAAIPVTTGQVLTARPADTWVNAIVAVVYDDEGNECDWVYTWETGQNYALSEGLRVVAVADDGHMSKEDAQALYDAERARYRDCYGVTTEPAPIAGGER